MALRGAVVAHSWSTASPRGNRQWENARLTVQWNKPYNVFEVEREYAQRHLKPDLRPGLNRRVGVGLGSSGTQPQ